jgi:UDP-N-acetylmuramoyl-L-alanyl-D-glutamate--2,6-diaminopimelate ligase
LAAARALALRVPVGEIVAWDASSAVHTAARGEQLEHLGVRTHLGGDGVALLGRAPLPRVLIKSPGISFSTPIIQAALDRGLIVIDEAELGWRLDRRPFVGVTGTNGKSTVAALVSGLLRACGHNPVVAGNTHFGPPLSYAATLAGDVVVAELSSFQLEGCPTLGPEAAVFTNLTYDHLYRHGTFEEYGRCKRQLFLRDAHPVGAAAVGVDQEFGRALDRELRSSACSVVSFGSSSGADRRVLDVRATSTGSSITVTEGGAVRTLATRLRGEHNALNVAAALALGDALGLDAALVARAAEASDPLPGRFERLETEAPFEIVVDYAHNPDGIRHTLETARAMLTERGVGSLRVVLSCLSRVGEQQAFEIGRAAGERADHVLLTSQDFPSGVPQRQISAGLREGVAAAGRCAIELEVDRPKAIAQSVADARPDDVVLILGRGERTGVWGANDPRTPFDDRVHARACVRELFRGSGGAE